MLRLQSDTARIVILESGQQMSRLHGRNSNLLWHHVVHPQKVLMLAGMHLNGDDNLHSFVRRYGFSH